MFFRTILTSIKLLVKYIDYFVVVICVTHINDVILQAETIKL